MNNFQKFLVFLFSLMFVATTMQYNKYLSQRKELNELQRQINNLKKLKKTIEKFDDKLKS